MGEKIFIIVVTSIFVYLLYRQYVFQKSIFFSYSEPFTPKDVNNIIQPPGSQPIGTINPHTSSITQVQTVSNGYTDQIIDNLKPTKPQPFSRQEIETLGNFPEVGQEKYPLPTNEFEYPNNYKFTVKYPCRPSSTGMYTDCGVWPANDAWTADPYKGLNCELHDTKTPKINTNFSQNRS